MKSKRKDNYIYIKPNKYIYINNYVFLSIREYAVKIKEICHINLIK